MKIVIAPDSFKESLSSVEVAHTIHQAFLLALHSAEYVVIPMADGGEGTLAALAQALPLTKHTVEVTGPLFKKHQAHYGVLQQDNTAIIEMSQASGLRWVPLEERDPLQTTTYGTGELILDAIEQGYRRIIIGLGGSATSDGGMGALTALGIEFKDITHQTLKPIGENLSKIASIDLSELDPRIAECEFVLAHDVDNPLLGLEGALMYAPQKGATPEDVELLHKGYENFSLQLTNTTGKSLGNLKGTGAAGGMAAGLFAFLNARLTPGAPLLMELVSLPEKLENANFVITGEGQLDGQSLHGKTPISIAKLAKSKNIPVIAFAAYIKDEMDELYQQGITAAFSIAPGPVAKEICLKYAKPLLMQSAYNVARLLKL